MRQILLASKEAQERPPLLGYMIADGSAQHRIPFLQRVEHRAQRDRRCDFERYLGAGVRQRSQVRRQKDSYHVKVCTSTLSTAGKSRTIGFQLSPASADA